MLWLGSLNPSWRRRSPAPQCPGRGGDCVTHMVGDGLPGAVVPADSDPSRELTCRAVGITLMCRSFLPSLQGPAVRCAPSVSAAAGRLDAPGTSQPNVERWMLPVACLSQWCFPPGIMNIIAAIMAVQASA